MGLLDITKEDTRGGRGAALPARTYRMTVESVGLETRGAGTMLAIVFGNIRTKEGATEFEHNGGTYHIGNRKVFARHWTAHTNPRATEVGHAFLKRLALSTGLAKVPSDGEVVTLDYENWDAFAEALAGREALILIRQRTRKGTDGEEVTEADVAAYLLP